MPGGSKFNAKKGSILLDNLQPDHCKNLFSGNTAADEISILGALFIYMGAFFVYKRFQYKKYS